MAHCHASTALFGLRWESSYISVFIVLGYRFSFGIISKQLAWRWGPKNLFLAPSHPQSLQHAYTPRSCNFWKLPETTTSHQALKTGQLMLWCSRLYISFPLLFSGCLKQVKVKFFSLIFLASYMISTYCFFLCPYSSVSYSKLLMWIVAFNISEDHRENRKSFLMMLSQRLHLLERVCTACFLLPDTMC